MKLSDAIVLGSTLDRMWGPPLGAIGNCAFQAAAQAVGMDRILSGKAIEREWPWLNIPKRLELPCKCLNNVDSQIMQIIHVFNTHVAAIYGDPTPQMTFEQFIDWVRQVEPSEPVAQEESDYRISSTVHAQETR